MSEETEQIRNKFDIVGMPTVLLINTKGDEVKRLTGFVDADEFLDILSQIN
jgi:thiol:disulfide interchange protein DsbD